LFVLAKAKVESDIASLASMLQFHTQLLLQKLKLLVVFFQDDAGQNNTTTAAVAAAAVEADIVIPSPDLPVLCRVQCENFDCFCQTIA
jgi:hypothetical protein